MKSRRQFRLRTFFLIFFAATIGLTCATAPKVKADPAAKILKFYVPQLNIHYALLTAAATAMVIGLFQQARTLREDKKFAVAGDASHSFARTIAIRWRILLALVIGGCLLARILITREVIRLPAHEDYFSHVIFPDNLLSICVIVVLIDCVRRWRPKNQRREHRWIEILALILGAFLAIVVLPDSNLITYLVNIATQGIERAEPFKFQRPNVFPNHEAEHFRTFWLSLGAEAAVLIAAIALILARNAKFKTRRFAATAVCYVTFLGIAAAFCIWFYTSEYRRVAPDLASVGFASNWLDWISGGVLITIVISVGAYRFAVRADALPVCPVDGGDSAEHVALHESALCLLLLLGAAIAYFVELARQLASQPGFFRSSPIADMLTMLLSSPESYIMLAISILSLQFCWVRWKRRENPPAWQLARVHRQRFVWSWLAFGLWIVVALPTMAIYSFTFWMGPWYLYGPK